MPLDAGDVVVLPFPYADLASDKQRPALVLTSAEYNADSPDVVAAYVTSQPQSGSWAVPLTQRDLADGSLARPSWIRPDKLASLEQRLVRKVVARLAPATLATVRGRLRRLLVEPARP